MSVSYTLYPWTTHLSPWKLLQIFKTPTPFKIKPTNVVSFLFLLIETVNSPLFVAHKKFGNERHVVSSLTWRSGSRELQAGSGAQPLPLQEKWALGSVWERVGDSALGRASGVHSFQDLCSWCCKRKAERCLLGLKELRKCDFAPICLPCLPLQNCILVKGKVTFLTLPAFALTLPQGHLISQRYGLLPWGNGIAVPPSCLFSAPTINFRENQSIFFVCLDHEHCVGRLNCCAWQLGVHETLH